MTKYKTATNVLWSGLPKGSIGNMQIIQIFRLLALDQQV